jgi:uncharacterized protein (TIRG00374 family)
MDNELVKDIQAKEIPFSKKNLLHSLIKIIIAVGLIFFIINKIKPKEILSAFYSSDYNFIILAFFLSFFNLYFQYIKWETVCRNYLNVRSKKKIFISLFQGFAAGIFTPARIGEYFSRGLALKEKPVLQVATATFIDKFFPLIIVSFFGGISSVLFFYYYNLFPLYITIPAFILIVIFLLALLYLLMKGKILRYVPAGIRQNKKFEKVFFNIEQLAELNFGFIKRMIFISTAFYFWLLLQFAVLIAAFAHSIHPLEYLWNGSLIMFAKSVIPQVSLGDLGIREGFTIYFYGKSGIAASTAFDASFFLFLINLVFPSLLGMILLYKKNND